MGSVRPWDSRGPCQRDVQVDRGRPSTHTTGQDSRTVDRVSWATDRGAGEPTRRPGGGCPCVDRHSSSTRPAGPATERQCDGRPRRREPQNRGDPTAATRPPDCTTEGYLPVDRVRRLSSQGAGEDRRGTLPVPSTSYP